MVALPEVSSSGPPLAGRFGRTTLSSFVAVFAAIAGHAPLLVAPASADGRATAYSVHMQARIPSRCNIRDVSRVIVLTREEYFGESGPLYGAARFRVECNVPYVLETAATQHRRHPRGQLIPLSASGDHLAMPNIPASSIDAEAASRVMPTQMHCSLSDTAGHDEECPLHADASSPPVLPRATARVRIAHTDMPQEVPSNYDAIADEVEIAVVTIEIGSRL